MNWYLRGKIGILSVFIWAVLYAWVCSLFPPLWDSIPAFLAYSLAYWLLANRLYKYLSAKEEKIKHQQLVLDPLYHSVKVNVIQAIRDANYHVLNARVLGALTPEIVLADAALFEIQETCRERTMTMEEIDTLLDEEVARLVDDHYRLVS